MTKTLTLLAASTLALVAAPVFAQAHHGPKVGQTRDAAIATASKMFARYDTNNDGAVTNDEVTAALQARATKTGKTFKPRAAKKFMKADANGDGKVTLDEFKAAAGARFDAVDTNKNGTIDANEVSAPAAGGGDGSEG